MHTSTLNKTRLTLAAVFLLTAASVWGETLQVPAAAPWWAHLGADTILVLHILGGTLGILTGFVAIAVSKGQQLHRVAGKVFFAAMFISYLLAAMVAPFLNSGQRPNSVAALLALYLLFSGVSAARRRTFTASWRERAGLVVAVFVTTMGMWFAATGLQSESGTVDGSPPQAFAIFILTGFAATLGELRVLKQGGLSPRDRQKRHLWRMCMSFFIACGSFFLGQPQVFPGWFNASFLPHLLTLAPLAAMVFFLIRLNRVNPVNPVNQRGV